MSPALSDADIGRIAAGLADHSLPKPQWTHAAHFAAALWYLRHRPGFDSAAMAPLIRAYNVATGGENSDSAGYHETITRASLQVAAVAMAAQPMAPLADVLAALLAGPAGRSDWLLEHWSRERLFSIEARRGWLAPDRAPLPEPAAGAPGCR